MLVSQENRGHQTVIHGIESTCFERYQTQENDTTLSHLMRAQNRQNHASASPLARIVTGRGLEEGSGKLDYFVSKIWRLVRQVCSTW